MTSPSTNRAPSKDKLKLLYDTHMVTIEVGIGKEHFVVHQSFLCAKSQYFAKALSGSFQESITRFIQLPDVSPVLFRIFVAWIYHDTLVYLPPSKTTIDEDFKSLRITEKDLEQQPTLHSESQYKANNNGSDSEDSDDDVTGPSLNATMPEASIQDTGSAPGSTNGSTPARTVQFEEEDFTTWSCDVLIKLYVFADRFDVRQLRISTLDALIATVDEPWDSLYVRYIYMNTPTESKLRDFAVQHTAYRCQFSVEGDGWGTYPHEFLEAVMITNGRRLPYKQCDECYKKAIEGLEEEDFLSGGLSREEDLPSYEIDPCFYHEHLDEEEHEACRVRRKSLKSAA
ncbi:hypothetical protein KCU73_g6459, partial [Aureobasidium melanogenum]